MSAATALLAIAEREYTTSQGDSTMRAILYPVDGPAQAYDIEDTLDALQECVGGYIEAVGVAPDVTAYVNEEGKLVGLPHNENATAVMHEIGRLRPSDYIAGPMLVIGFQPATGEHMDLPVGVCQECGRELHCANGVVGPLLEVGHAEDCAVIS